MEIELAGGAGVAQVDDSDAAAVVAHSWYRHDVRGKSYARSRSAGYLHRFLMGLTKGDRREVDHIDGDGLNCRWSNMRVCTHAENHQNRRRGYGASSYRGVSWHPRGQWLVRVKVDGTEHFGGYFDDEDEAGSAAAALRERLMPFATG